MPGGASGCGVLPVALNWWAQHGAAIRAQTIKDAGPGLDNPGRDAWGRAVPVAWGVTEMNRETIAHCKKQGGQGVRGDWGGAEQCGPVAVPYRVGSAERFRRLRGAVADYLPQAWAGKIHAIAKAARGACDKWEGDRAAGDVYAHWLGRYAGADGADLSEQAIRDRAETIAARARAARFVVDANGRAWASWARLCAFVAGYGGAIVHKKNLQFGVMGGAC